MVDTITREMFFDTLREFRNKFCTKEFWEKEQSQRDINFEAVTQDYLRCEHGEHLQTDADSFNAVIQEYHMREFYVLMNNTR